jgi:hypothetical protein
MVKTFINSMKPAYYPVVLPEAIMLRSKRTINNEKGTIMPLKIP